MGSTSVLLAVVAGVVLAGCLLWLVRSNSRVEDSAELASADEVECRVSVDETLELAIRNAISPAAIDRVICCSLPRRAIVVVREDQLGVALGEDRQNEKVVTAHSGWNVEIMTNNILDERVESALLEFEGFPGIDEQLADRLAGEGILSFADLSTVKLDDLQEMSGLTALEIEGILSEAKRRAAIECRESNSGDAKWNPYPGSTPSETWPSHRSYL
jgi:hypothetical protein